MENRIMKKWIRVSGLIAFIVIVVLVGIVWFFFVDAMVKSGIEKTGTFIVGAKVELDDADRGLIRKTIEESPYRMILVTHGTDTMTETGRALEGIPGRTIVLTGALLPARFRDNDAIFNIGFALAAVQSMPEGVYICMNGRIFEPGRVRKNREMNCFEEI